MTTTRMQPSLNPSPENRPVPRLRRAERQQAEMRCESLDQRLPAAHRVRAVWAYVAGLDLSELEAKIAAVEGQVGRNATDPRILLSLWLFATLEGIGSARALDQLCRWHRAYEWLCGGVSLNYHTLADFRVAHGEFLDTLLTHSVAALLHQGLVRLKRVAQDGVRVRAGAGASSFRRRASLQECLEKAQQHVEALRSELDGDASAATKRQKAARQRAARERAQRVAQALAELAVLEQHKEAREKGSSAQARASTTDPEARRMKMADGGFRPAYNVQFATDTASGIIVGVDALPNGSDGGQMAPMVEQIEQRYGQAPEEYLTDGGFSTLDDIEEVSTPERGTKVFTPVKDVDKKRAAGMDPYAPRPGDSPTLAEWRQRMGTPEARAIYPQRAATAEWVNAQARNHGMYQFRVRGQGKVRMIALWFALALNLQRTLKLCAPPGVKPA